MTKRMAMALTVLVAGCGAEELGESTLEATWTFETGDCASNGVETVRVTLTPSGGAPDPREFPCADGAGVVGELDGEPASFSVEGEGLDRDGVVRAENFGQTTSYPDGRALRPIEILLRPKSSNIIVSWNGCPGSVVLPYFVTVYEPGADGAVLGPQVGQEVQESCMSRSATVMLIPPGDYVVEVDSRAVTPAVRGTAPVSVIAGEDAEVTVDVP